MDAFKIRLDNMKCQSAYMSRRIDAIQFIISSIEGNDDFTSDEKRDLRDRLDQMTSEKETLQKKIVDLESHIKNVVSDVSQVIERRLRVLNEVFGNPIVNNAPNDDLMHLFANVNDEMEEKINQSF